MFTQFHGPISISSVSSHKHDIHLPYYWLWVVSIFKPPENTLPRLPPPASYTDLTALFNSRFCIYIREYSGSNVIWRLVVLASWSILPLWSDISSCYWIDVLTSFLDTMGVNCAAKWCKLGLSWSLKLLNLMHQTILVACGLLVLVHHCNQGLKFMSWFNVCSIDRPQMYVFAFCRSKPTQSNSWAKNWGLCCGLLCYNVSGKWPCGDGPLGRTCFYLHLLSKGMQVPGDLKGWLSGNPSGKPLETVGCQIPIQMDFYEELYSQWQI